jgi:hypothetical protein
MWDYGMIGLFCAIAALLIVFPICRFLLTQWDFRRERLFGFLAGGAIIPYYEQFRPGSSIMMLPLDKRNPLTADTYIDAFQADFFRWYGRRYYVVPIFLLAILTAGSVFWGVETLRQWSISSIDFKTYRAVTASALAGDLFGSSRMRSTARGAGTFQ